MINGSAVVTGGAQGIGFAIARKLSERGVPTVLTDIDGEAAQAAAESLGPHVVAVTQDVRDPESHRLVAHRAQQMAPLSLWVNNAGVLASGAAWQHSDDESFRLLDVNIRGVVAGSRAAIEAMTVHGGTIINIASLSALVPVPGLALYAASKAAVLSFTGSLQGDLDRAGLPIKARALCPDVAWTSMVSARLTDPSAAILFSGPKHLHPDEVAVAALALVGSRQVFRVMPRWRGVMARTLAMSPAFGLRLADPITERGRRRQISRRGAESQIPPGV